MVTYTLATAESIAKEMGVLRMSVISLEHDLQAIIIERDSLKQQNTDLAQANAELRKTIDLIRSDKDA